MQPVQNKSKTKFAIIGVIIAVLLVIIGGAAYAFIQLSTHKEPTASQEQTEDPASSKQVSQQKLNRDLNDINESIDKSKEAHTAAQAAVNDPSKRVKVSE